jgi:hypothetical protein
VTPVVGGTPPAEVLRVAYSAFGAVVRGITEESSWLPTGCAGWAVRDLIYGLLGRPVPVAWDDAGTPAWAPAAPPCPTPTARSWARTG